MFSPSTQANDNVALLEAGLKKDIDKNTARLLKQEKELEAFGEIKNYIDLDKAGQLHPEAEAGKASFKLYLAFKAEHVSLIAAYLNMKLNNWSIGCQNGFEMCCSNQNC